MIGIVDYGAGNIRSVRNALRTIDVEHVASSDVETLRRADKLILPGVGEARMAMASLDRRELSSWLKEVRVPFLGICLGMQLLFESSTERQTPCLGVVPGAVVRLDAAAGKVPHVGWNEVRTLGADPLFAGIETGEYFYFLHSYCAPPRPEAIALTDYGTAFTSAVRKGNYCGVQFHPEKSGRAGLRLLKNFADRC